MIEKTYLYIKLFKNRLLIRNIYLR